MVSSVHALFHLIFILKSFYEPAWWFTPVIPALWEAEVGRSPKVGSSRLAWPTWQNPISTKNAKVSWAWWQVPIVPAAQEADARETLDLRRWRFQ